MAEKNEILVIDIKTEKQVGSFRTLEEFENSIIKSLSGYEVEFSYFWDGSKEIPSGVLTEITKDTLVINTNTYKII